MLKQKLVSFLIASLRVFLCPSFLYLSVSIPGTTLRQPPHSLVLSVLSPSLCVSAPHVPAV